MKTAIIYSLVLLWQIYKLRKILSSLKFCKSIIKQIQQLQVLSISGLKQKIKNKFCQIGDMVICKGKLSAPQKIRSLLNPNRYVVFSNLVMDKVFEIGETRNTVRKNIRKIYHGFLKLTQNGKSINIYETMKSNLIHSQVITTVNSYREKLFNFSWLFSLFLRSPTRIISNVYKQSLIPNDAQSVVFGSISQNNSGEIQFFRPIAIASSKQRMRMFYKQQIDNLTFLWYLLIFAIFITIFFIFRYLISTNLIRRIIRREAHKKQSEFNQIQQIYVKDLNCLKCKKQLSSIINNPCQHLAICTQCNTNENKCIQCYSQPKSVIMVYPS